MTPMTTPMTIPMMSMMIMLRQVEFKHTNAKLDVKGLGGKIIQKLSNSVSKFAMHRVFVVMIMNRTMGVPSTGTMMIGIVL